MDKPKAKFEGMAPKEELVRSKGPTTCNFTRNVVVPFLEEKRKNGKYVDLGHFHNRINILECLAEILQSKLALVRLRRNRYQIARSFSVQCRSPCRFHGVTNPIKDIADGKVLRPGMSYCPRSDDENGPPALLVPSDDVWDAFSSFQQFLWMADDLEYRWYRLLKGYALERSGVVAPPWLHEVTWTTGTELEDGLYRVLETEMQCRNHNHARAPLENSLPHVSHNTLLNCTDQIWQDLRYRQQVLPLTTKEQAFALFQQFPQPLVECAESTSQLRDVIREAAARLGVGTDLRHWSILPNKEVAAG